MNLLQPPPSERQVQRSILRMIGTCFRECLVHHSPNGAHLAGGEVARFKQMGALLGDGMKRGWPDLIVLWSPNKGCLIEVKRQGGRLSPEQKAMHELLQSLRWPIATVRSFEEAYLFLVACGAPRSAELVGVAA